MAIKSKIYNLLRWSQKYTKTDMVYLAKGGFWLTLGDIISLLGSFLLAIAFANLLPKETYGVYGYILSITTILIISTLKGIDTAIIQAVAQGHEASFVPALKTKIKWGLIGGIIGLMLAGYYYINNNTTLTISFLIISLFIPFIDSFNIYISLLQGKKLFNISTKYGVISQIIAVIILITTLFLTKNLFLILFIYFILWTLLGLIFFKITLKKYPPNSSKDPQTISYGKHLSLIEIISTIASQIDKILIFQYLGAVELAIYTLAITPVDKIKGLLKNIHPLALPKFSQRTTEEIKKTILKKMLKFGLAIFVIVIIYIFIAPFVFKIFFPQYSESVFYSQIYAISLIATIIMLPIAFLESKLAKKTLYKLNIYNSIFQITVLFLLVYFYGILGAIIAGILGRFIGLGLTFFFIKKIK